jgi:GntR family transcriptional regulator
MEEFYKTTETRCAMIRRIVRKRIVTGAYLPGAMIPTENELSEEFEASRLTVRSALDELVHEGYLKRIQGKGTFVIEDYRTGLDTDRMTGFREAVRAQGRTPSVRIVERYVRPAGALHAEIFGIDATDEVYFFRRVNMIDGVATEIETVYVPLGLFPGIETVDVANYSLFRAFEARGHKVEAMVKKLGITTLSVREARALDATPGDFAMTLETMSYDARGTAVEHSWTTLLPGGDGVGFKF